MPESITDRPATAHEKVFLFTKSERYWYDSTAVRTGLKQSSIDRLQQDIEHQSGSLRANGGMKATGPMKAVGQVDKVRAVPPRHEGHANHKGIDDTPRGTANLKNVWSIATRPFSGAHFATFPPELPEICIRAGSSERGVCSECGVPWSRDIESELIPTAKACRVAVVDERDRDSDYQDQGSNRQKDGHLPGMARAIRAIGWRPGCACDAATMPATVLDPFGGAGTTGLVAAKLLRNATLIELNPTYARIAVSRLRADLVRVVVDGDIEQEAAFELSAE